MARLLAALIVASLPALAAPAEERPLPRDPDGSWAVEIKVGDRYPICKSGAILCPATVPICDDPAVATMGPGRDGLEIVAAGPGKTLCSAMSANQARAVFRVTVR